MCTGGGFWTSTQSSTSGTRGPIGLDRLTITHGDAQGDTPDLGGGGGRGRGEVTQRNLRPMWTNDGILR